jgi:transposase
LEGHPAGEGRERTGSTGRLRDLGVTIACVGLEARPLSQRLYGGLHKAAFEAVLLETRHVKAALSSATAIKTGRRDVPGIARLPWMGWCGRCVADRCRRT